MNDQVKNECQCANVVCGCDNVSAKRCTCGGTCQCAQACRCDRACACWTAKSSARE